MLLLGIGLYIGGAALFYGWMVRFATPMEEEAGVRLRVVAGGMLDEAASERKAA